jgi:hypothetical protein
MKIDWKKQWPTVAVGVLVLVAAIALLNPDGKGRKNQIRATHLKALGQAAAMYASQSNDVYPPLERMLAAGAFPPHIIRKMIGVELPPEYSSKSLDWKENWLKAHLPFAQLLTRNQTNPHSRPFMVERPDHFPYEKTFGVLFDDGHVEFRDRETVDGMISER